MNFSLNRNLSQGPDAPRTLGSTIHAWAARMGRALWRALEAQGRSRARLELRRIAERYEASQPELAKELRAASRYDA